MQDDRLLTPDHLTTGHPRVTKDGGHYTIKGAVLQGGNWDLDRVIIHNLSLEDCHLDAPITLRSVQNLALLRVQNLQREFKSENPDSPADFDVQLLNSLASLELSGTSNVYMKFSIKSITDCNISGAIEKLAIVATRFDRSLTISELHTNDIRFANCGFTDSLNITKLRADWLVFRNCSLGSPTILQGVEGHKDGLNLLIDSCSVVNGVVSLSEIEADVVFLCGLRIQNGATVSLIRVNAARFLDWSHINIDESARLEFRHTPLFVSYFDRTQLDQVHIGDDCWNESDRGTKLYLHTVLASATNGTVQIRPIQVEYWPVSLRISEAIQSTHAHYSQLIKYYEDRRNFGLAEKFYVGEMDMVRWRLSTSKNKTYAWIQRNVSVIGLYRLLSVYGSNYRRAFLSLVFTTFGFAVIFFFTGLDCTKDAIGCKPIGYSQNLGGNFFAQIQSIGSDLLKAAIYILDVATLQKDITYRPANPFGSVVRTAVIVVFASQVTLLVFALRRRFRRAMSI